MRKIDFSALPVLPSASRMLAVCIGLAIPASYLGSGLQSLLMLLAFALLLTPALRSQTFSHVSELARNTQIRWLTIVFLALLPSLFVSGVPSVSWRTWIAGIIVLLCFGALGGGFKQCPAHLQKLTVKILILGLLTTCMFITFASIFERHLMLGFWRWAETLGLASVKGSGYYLYNKTKLFTTGIFIVMPLLLYCSFGYFTKIRWRIASIVTILFLLFLISYITNRSALAGLMAMLAVAAFISWHSRSIKGWVKLLASILLVGIVVSYGIYASYQFGDIFSQQNSQKIRDNYKVRMPLLQCQAISRERFDGNHHVLDLDGNNFVRCHILKKDKTFPAFLSYALLNIERQVFIYEAFRTWQENPLWGIGVNSTSYHQPLRQNVTDYAWAASFGDQMTHVHNRFMEVLLETGLFGFSAFLIFLTCVFYQNLRKFIIYNHLPSLLVLLTHTGYWVSGMFQYSIWELWTTMVFLLVLVLIYALEKPVEKSA